MNEARRGFLRLAFGGGRARPAARSIAILPLDPFEAELERLRRVDPRLLRYDEVDRIGLGLRQPRGIGTGEGKRLWTVGDSTLLLHVDGREVLRIALTESAACVSESQDGERVYVGLRSRIEVRGRSGRPLAAWPVAKGAIVTSIVASDRVVVVADAGRRVVERRDPDGRLLGALGDSPGGRGHFLVPSPYLDLALTRAGVVWTTNPGRHRVEGYSLEGQPVSSFGTPGAAIEGFCGCCNPTHIAALPDGRLVTSEKGLPRVKVLDAAGRLESVVADGRQLAGAATGLDLAVDERGRILLLDPRARAVRVFAPRPEERRPSSGTAIGPEEHRHG